MRKKIDFSLSDLDLQMLPHNKQLEEKIIAMIFKHPNLYHEGYKYLKPKGMFYEEFNVQIWGEMTKSVMNGVVINQNTIAGHFKSKAENELYAYTMSVDSGLSFPSEFPKMCLRLNEYWMQRTFIRMGHYMVTNATNETMDSLDLLGVISDSTSKIFLHMAGMKEKTLSDAAAELNRELVNISLSPNGMLGIPSSIRGINKVIKGYRKGNLIILGASTAEGKTTLALQEVHNLIKQGIPVGYISLEMATYELLLMMACAELKINTEKVLDNELTTEELNRLGAYIDKLKKMPLYISDKSSMKMGEAYATAKMWKDKHDIQLLVIDHLHLLNGDIEYSTPEQKFTNIANRCKEIAKELDIPEIALVQLSRKEITEKRAHLITDIKYAGGIEQAADIVMLLFRPYHHGIETDGEGNSVKDLARIMVAKLRLLPRRDVKCKFDGMRFYEEETYYNPHAGITNRTNSYHEDNPF